MKLITGDCKFCASCALFQFNQIVLFAEECPEAVKEIADMENLTGRKVAIDASMALYQFLVAGKKLKFRSY